MKQFIAATAALILSAGSCLSATPQLGAANYPRVDGSTSTQALQSLVKSRILGKDLVTQHSDTGQSYKNLVDRRTDLILVARDPAQKEKADALARGMTLDARPIALDALVFLVNKDNAVDNLTTDQIRKIYSGELTQWEQLHIPGAPVGGIRAYRRDSFSGSEELMQSLVMRGLPMTNTALREPPSDRVVAPMGAAVLNIADTRLSITYSIYYYMKYAQHLLDDKLKHLEILGQKREKRVALLAKSQIPEKDGEYWLELIKREQEVFEYEERKSRAGIDDLRKAIEGSKQVKMIKVDGAEPSERTIASRQYPFTAEVYAVVRGNDPKGCPAFLLRDWLLSPKGQSVVAESGYAPIAEPTASPGTARSIIADNVSESVGNKRWNWTVFIKGDREAIDAVKCVEYKLHPTFPDPIRLVCDRGDLSRPFGLSATGWGTFSIGIRVFMKDGSHKDLKHQLKF